MKVHIIQVPYDSGHAGMRSGNGPDHFLKNGIDKILQNSGHGVHVSRVQAGNSFSTEIGTTFEANRALAECVGTAVNNHRLPIVLAGNCNSCIGTIASYDPAFDEGNSVLNAGIQLIKAIVNT